MFASRRDSRFMASINREVLNRITGMEVLFYRLSIEATPTSIYDESTSKTYFDPVVLGAHIAKQDVTTEDTELGLLESSQAVIFGLLREELETLQIVVQVGDIFKWDSGYYEVDNVRKENYWWGRNPHEFIAADRGAIPSQGWAFAVVAETHRSSVTSVNLVSQRTGVNNLVQTDKFKGF